MDWQISFGGSLNCYQCTNVSNSQYPPNHQIYVPSYLLAMQLLLLHSVYSRISDFGEIKDFWVKTGDDQKDKKLLYLAIL